MGQGSKELGKQLLKMFIYSLTEQPDLPEKIIFYNGGVHLVSDNSDSLEDLQILAENGIEIYACGACLNYYNLSEKCKVGEVTNMYHIIEMMRKSKKIIKP
ncbi:sulfurtransferase-like selenium metabolism protein YedF [Enterococcus hirae]